MGNSNLTTQINWHYLKDYTIVSKVQWDNKMTICYSDPGKQIKHLFNDVG